MTDLASTLIRLWAAVVQHLAFGNTVESGHEIDPDG
jgi:hypothetical protein